MKKILRFTGVLLLLVTLSSIAGAARLPGKTSPNAPVAVYYVATGGSDDTGDGSASTPWATITHALDNVPDGSTVLVRPGTYHGRVRLRGTFEQGVVVRSEVPYQARLRHSRTVVTCFYGQGITLEGFDIAHSAPVQGGLVIQVQDLIEGQDDVSRITLQNNVLHDSLDNDILKINNGAGDVLVQGNLFYNQAGSDEHMDVNSVTNVVIQDNVFFNDFAGSGRDDDDTSSFVVIKDSNGADDGQLGSEHIVVRRNVFLHWEGSSGQGYVRVGEDGTANHEARDVLVENNLMIGNNTQQIRSPFQLMGVYSVTIRANTVAGDMPAKEYGARIFAYGDNPDNDQIHLHNNIWSDPSGTMGDTFNRGNRTHNLSFDNNLFWNDGNAFPTSSESIIEVTDDAHRVEGDPLLGDQAGLVLPRWDPDAGQFADGSATVRQVFERLVSRYGVTAPGSPAIDAADPAHAPGEDILGQPRPAGPAPDVGAFEYQGYDFSLSVEPPFRAIQSGGSAVYALHVSALGAFSATVALTHSLAPPGLLLDLEPATVLPGGAATLTLTDTHSGTLLPGLAHTLTLTGTSASATATETVRLLVGGARLYLPLLSQKPDFFLKTRFLQNPSHSAGPRSTAGWWDDAWPYRVPVTVSGDGVVQASVDFGAQLDALGLNHALLDIRSIRVLPDGGATPLPHAESYSVMLEDADDPQVGWSDSGVYWTVNDGEAQADASRFSQGSGSLKATVENLPGGYGYPGVELHVASGDPLVDWRPYETLVYDVWPQVNASALDQAPDLYWFKLYNACDGSPVTQGGPPLALDQWNYASVSLNPLDACWPADGLNLSDITRMEFHTRDDVDGDVSGPNGFWDDGDVLTLWFDNLRLVDQEGGSIRWQTQPGVSQYYIYFDVLTHEGHPLPPLDEGLGNPTLTGSAGAAEAGGYYHQVSGATALGDLQVWAAPTVEKVLRAMAAPVASAPLQIAAARGEFEPFQIVVRAPSDVSLNVSVGDFVKGSDVITGVTIHRVDYVNITTAGDHFDRFGPWPDPLWPLNDGQAVSFTANENQPLWFTVQVPWDAPAGLYQATVGVGSARIPVSLQVWDFSLPREIHLLSEWGFDWSGIVEDVYQGTAGDWECYWDVVEAFKQDFINHRLIPKGVAWPAGLNYPGGVEYDCNGNLDPDAWGEWDFATIGGKYIHGQDGFNAGYGFPAFLSHGPADNWPPDSLPYSFCEISRDGVLGSTAFQNKWKQYLGAVDAYIVSDGYDDAAYYHIVNEPQTYDDYAIVGQISALTESAAPHLRQLVSEQVEPDIYNYPGAKIDVWMPTISNYEPVESHDRQANHGEEVWWYYLYGDDPPLPNPILMSHPGMEARLTPWLAWAERVDGLLHYDATDWISDNPWTTPNVTDKDNGDGFFFYPPRQDGGALDYCGQNGNRLVPSIRWENLRDGMEDYEYLWLLAGGDPEIDVSNAADAYVAQLVGSRTRFSHVPTDLAATRAALALALGPPSFAQSLDPPAVAPGEALTYTLTYRHQGADATLVATDTVPAITPVVTATGPGLVQVAGQEVYWRVPVSAGLAVSLSIHATAGATPGAALNTVAFAGVPLPDDHMPVLIYSHRIFLPLALRQESG